VSEEEIAAALGPYIRDHALGPGEPTVQLVKWPEEDWGCPVCGNTGPQVPQGTRADILRPLDDKDWIRGGIICTCPDCEWEGAIEVAAEASIREELDLPQTIDIAAARIPF
jgi:hypothetical protein